MFNYFAFLESGIRAPSADPHRDGVRLAEKCMKKLRKLNDPDQFPPRLLILIASCEYLPKVKAQRLIDGIYTVFPETVPLIGSSAAAVFFDNRISERGALLICIASRLIRARVAVGEGADGTKAGVSRAVRRVVEDLGLKPATVAASALRGPKHKTVLSQRLQQIRLLPDPLPHTMILTFLSGSGPDPLQARAMTESLHRGLWEEVEMTIPIVGGVSSANDPKRRKAAIQFAGRSVYKHAVVAALISSGVPLGENLSNGVEWKKRKVLTVKTWSKDGQMIEEFDQGRPSRALAGIGRVVLLKEAPRTSDRIVAISESVHGRREVKMLRELSKDRTPLVPGSPTPDTMYAEAKKAIERSLQSTGMKNPVGCLSLKCISHQRYREILGLAIEDGIKAISKRMLNRRPYVGGFFDGEIGTDKTGRSAYGNWGVATLRFGDELSDDALRERGYSSLRSHSARLSGESDWKTIVTEALDLVYDLGFPGGMLSLMMTNDARVHAVATKGRGPRFGKLSNSVLFDLSSETPLARIIRDGVSRTVSVPIEKDGRKKANAGAIRSYQFVIPLFDPVSEPIALLQVDLGTASSLNRGQANLSDRGKECLDLVGRLVTAALNRVFLWNEKETVRKLDEALVTSLETQSFRDPLQLFLEEALVAFDLKMGHIRRLDQKKRLLVLTVGTGDCHDKATTKRRVLDLGGQTPTVNTFNSKRMRITNDAEVSDEYHQLLRETADPEARKALYNVRSYAIVPFSRSEEKDLTGATSLVTGDLTSVAGTVSAGTVNLLSSEKWFFKEYHKEALHALSNCVRFLIEHLDNKRDEAILKGAIPILSDIKRDDNMRLVLQRSIEAFCTAIGAQYGSLYLEDKDSSLYPLLKPIEWRSEKMEDHSRSLYVLRAQYNWQSELDWVDTAFYKDDEGWIGHTALKAKHPLYVEDLQKEYADRTKYERITKRYDVEIFGDAMSELNPIEAVAVPLEAGGETLGVLTAYRKVAPPASEQPVGFRNITDDLLKLAANPFAGLVNLVWDRRRKEWDDIKESLRDVIFRPLDGQELQHPELNICRTLATNLSAKRVDFYKVRAERPPEWVVGVEIAAASLRRAANPDLSLRENVAPAADNRQVAQAGFIIDAATRSYKGVLTRACIPLLALGEKMVVGVLVLHWDKDSKQAFPLVGHLGMQFLAWLGRRIGSAYRQYDLDAELEMSRANLDVSNIHEEDRMHEVGKYAREIIEKSEANPDLMDVLQWARGIQECLREDTNPPNLERPRTRENLRDMLHRALYKVSRLQSPHGIEPMAHLKQCIDRFDEVWVFGSRDAIEVVLASLVENALEATESTEAAAGASRTSVKLETNDTDKTVHVLISDNGPGPSEVLRVIAELEKGQIPMKNGRRQKGIELSRTLAPLMRGSVEWKENSSDTGTLAIVTLSLAEEEG